MQRRQIYEHENVIAFVNTIFSILHVKLIPFGLENVHNILHITFFIRIQDFHDFKTDVKEGYKTFIEADYDALIR